MTATCVIRAQSAEQAVNIVREELAAAEGWHPSTFPTFHVERASKGKTS